MSTEIEVPVTKSKGVNKSVAIVLLIAGGIVFGNVLSKVADKYVFARLGL